MAELSLEDLAERLSRLAGSEPDLPADLQALRSLAGQAADALAHFDAHAALETLRKWLEELWAAEPPPDTVTALAFGLFEPEDGCTLYVTGSVHYDPNDDSWAASNDWWPDGRYAPFPELAQMAAATENSGADSWPVVQALVIVLLKQLLAGPMSQPLGRYYIATGFDDGDLFPLQQSGRVA
jgi:hypothetical protein